MQLLCANLVSIDHAAFLLRRNVVHCFCASAGTPVQTLPPIIVQIRYLFILMTYDIPALLVLLLCIVNSMTQSLRTLQDEKSALQKHHDGCMAQWKAKEDALFEQVADATQQRDAARAEADAQRKQLAQTTADRQQVCVIGLHAWLN